MESAGKIEAITTGQDNCNVLGRLIRLWDSRNMNSTSTDSLISIDGIILDESGKMVQINVPKKFDKQFTKLLDEGFVYKIGDVTAVPINNRSFVYHHQHYMLQFKSTTKINPLTSRGADIPRHSFHFCPFDQLPSKRINTRPLLDLIGVIVNVGSFDYAGPRSPKKLRRIKIQNLDGQEEEVVLWGQHGEQFDVETVINKSKEGIVVAVFAGLTAGAYSGKNHVASSSATKVFIELNIPDVAHFHTSYKRDKPMLQTPLAPQDDRLHHIEATGQLYKLDQISALPMSSFQNQATFSCIAKVTSILHSTNWYYKACGVCNMGYNKNSDTPRCTNCKVPVPKALYKLPIIITDETSSMETVAFNFVGEELVELTAHQVSQEMKISADTHVPALDKAIGKTRLFKIGMNTEFSTKFSNNYVIRKSFQIDNSKDMLLLQTKQPSSSENIENNATESTKQACSMEISILTTPPSLSSQSSTTTVPTSSTAVTSNPTAKKALNFTQEGDNNPQRSEQQQEKITDKDEPTVTQYNSSDNTANAAESSTKRLKKS